MKRPGLGRVGGAMIALLAGGPAGCGDGARAESERVVRAYCEAVIVAYRTRDVTDLQPLVTDKELRKIVALIDIKVAGGLVLESTLEALEVTSVDLPDPGVMTVSATERWRYFDRPLDVGEQPGTEFVVDMDLEYTFIDQDGVWKMDQARTMRHDYLEPEGFAPEGRDAYGMTGHEESS